MTDIIAKTHDSLRKKLNVNASLGTDVMMILGAYRFGISNATYQTLKRETQYQWEAINRIGAEPALQYTGKAVETLELEGVIYPHYQGGLSQLSFMRAQGSIEKPLMLISGNGFTFGRWCIASVSETNTFFLQDGTPRKIEFTINLKKYGEDKAVGLKGHIQSLAGAV